MVCIVQLPYFPSLKACSESCHDSSVTLVRNVSSFIFSHHWLPELGTTTQLTTGISNVLPFLLTQVAEMLIFPSESSWADSCYPGCSFLCFVLLVAIGVGFFPWGRSVNMGRSRKPTVSFFNFIFFLKISGLFNLLLFLILTVSGICLNVLHHLIYSSPSIHERNFHTLPECHN